MKKCLCGCNQDVISPDKKGRERFYKHGHNPAGINTRFKRGVHTSIKTEFKSGIVPWNKNRGKNKPICPNCGNKKKLSAKLCRTCWFKVNPPWNKGKVGVQKGLKGKDNPMWDGGKTSLRYQILNSTEYKQWSKKNKERDGFRCRECGILGGKLHTDHIHPFFLILRENKITNIQQALNCPKLWDHENGRTLCINCHKKTPTYGNKLYYQYFKQLKEGIL